MRTTLSLLAPAFDDDRLKKDESIFKDFSNNCQITVFNNPNFIDDENTTAFSVWLEYGRNQDKNMMFDTSLDDLELFAHSVLKMVEMVRRDYPEDIKAKIKADGFL